MKGTISKASVTILLIVLITSCSVYGNTFTVNSLNNSGDGSLRWAIEQANANSGTDTINFSVSGTILPLSALPSITDDDTIIDASSRWDGAWPGGQPGITLDGSSAGEAYGLRVINSDNCRIRGLFITDFEKDGIIIGDGSQFNTVGGTGAGYRNVVSGNGQCGVCISGLGHNIVSGNYIGVDPTGTTELANGDGVGLFWTASNVVGGTTPNERNIISGNYEEGVNIGNSTSNIVSGNYIGTDASGTTAIGNRRGIHIIDASSNIIGGTQSGERNVISGNNMDGIFIVRSGATNNVVLGNYIGVDASGNNALGNLAHGVGIYDSASSNIIGQSENTIAFNNGVGVMVDDPNAIYNKISRNSIHNNALVGIALVPDANMGITPATITSGIIVDSTLHVEGAGARANATIELFKADSFESGEGMVYLASLIADENGDYVGNIAVADLSIGDPLTSTTTDTDNNTSQFSPPVTLLSPAQSTDELSNTVADMELDRGAENSLTSPLENASDAIERDNTNAAIGQLRAFINHVEAQRGKKISEEEADLLIAWAESVIAALQADAAPAPARKEQFSPTDKLTSKWGQIKAK